MTPDAVAPLRIFAVTAPGLEHLAEAELSALGIRAARQSGGVEWEGTPAELYAANLRLRTASRVLVRLGEFRARTFHELERHARRLPWERFVARGRAVEIRVTSRKSKLYHEGAVAQRLHDAVERAVGAVRRASAAAGDEEAEGAAAQLVVTRFHYDRCTVSVDSSGALLHLRGYRQAVAKAPMRETLAASMLLGAGWRGEAPLVDPLCGSGTIPIEAALIARGIAPGLACGAPRRYAFEEWPELDRGAWDSAVAAARAEARPAAGVPIVGADRDAGAIEAARANAARAGVLDDLELAVQPLSALTPPDAPGLLLANPPYGVRVGEERPLRDLYAAIGRLARGRLPGWRVGLLSAEPRLEAQVGLAFRELFRTRNGGIPVRLIEAAVDAASAADATADGDAPVY